jgi:hypothetical protein
MPDPSTSRSSAADHTNRRGTRRFVLAAFLLITAVGVAAVGASPLFEHSDHDVLAVDGPVTHVVVELDRGNVEVVASADRRNRSVTVERRPTWRLAEPTVEHRVGDGVLEVTARCPREVPIASRCWVDHRLEVPRGAAVSVRTGRGSITVESLRGAVDVRTGSGSVLGATLGSHDIVVISDGGDVSLRFTEMPSRVEVASGGGDVDLVVPGGPFDLDVSDSGGTVEVEVPTRAHAEALLTVASDGGAVRVRPPGEADLHTQG